MANTQVVSTAPDYIQSGTYSAIELRRSTGGWFEGVLDRAQAVDVSTGIPVGDFAVTQRAAGAGLGVDVAAGEAFVMGDTQAVPVTDGLYYVRSEAALTGATQIDIAAADPTNPRVDLIVLEVKDSVVDGSGLNQAQVRCVTGTPSASLTNWNSTTGQTENNAAYNGSGGSIPAVPSSAIPLAAVYVPANDTTISNDQILDLRPSATGWYYKAYFGTLTHTVTAGYTYPSAAGNPASNRPFINCMNVHYLNGFIEFAAATAIKASGAGSVNVTINNAATGIKRLDNANTASASSLSIAAGGNALLVYTAPQAEPITNGSGGTVAVIQNVISGASDQTTTAILSNVGAFPRFTPLVSASGTAGLSSNFGLASYVTSAGTVSYVGYIVAVRIPPMFNTISPDILDGGRGPRFVHLRNS